MHISQLILTSGFGELHFFKESLTVVGATKEGYHFSCLMGQVRKPSTDVAFYKTIQAIKKSHLGVYVSLQFSEFHLAIVRTVFHCQIKRMSKQLYFNLISSEL